MQRTRTGKTSSPCSLTSAASPQARARTITVWMSCPQACITPGFSEAKSRPVCSWMGRASMSPRKAIIGASAGPMSTVAPVEGNARGSSPASRSLLSRNSVVAISMWDSSGLRCSWRRHCRIISRFSSTHALTKVEMLTRSTLALTFLLPSICSFFPTPPLPLPQLSSASQSSLV